jgi:hypothetical protein
MASERGTGSVRTGGAASQADGGRGRGLSKAEIELLDWLLASASVGPTDVVREWDNYQAISGCDCGCPSVDLSLRGDATETDRTIAEAHGTSPEGTRVLVWLRAGGRALTELEIVPVSGTVPMSLPRPESLEPERAG